MTSFAHIQSKYRSVSASRWLTWADCCETDTAAVIVIIDFPSLSFCLKGQLWAFPLTCYLASGFRNCANWLGWLWRTVGNLYIVTVDPFNKWMKAFHWKADSGEYCECNSNLPKEGVMVMSLVWLTPMLKTYTWQRRTRGYNQWPPVLNELSDL